jgi:hypothetical protein
MQVSTTLRSLAFVACCFAQSLSAGTFFSDFDSGAPERMHLYGSAVIENRGGDNDTGAVKLTKALINQKGTLLLDPLDGKEKVASFIATFKMLIANGSGADGMAFHYGPNLPEEPFSDISPTGVEIVFDSFANARQIAPGIRSEIRGNSRAEVSIPNLRTNRFVDVMVKMDPDGTVDVSYDDEIVFTNAPSTATNVVGRFAIGARTGSRTDDHFVDDLRIVTQTTPRAFVETYLPNGKDVAPSSPIEVLFQNSNTKVDPKSILMTLDGAAIIPEISVTPEGLLRASYFAGPLMRPESQHTVLVQYSDNATPTQTQEFIYHFRITSAVYIAQ